MDIYQRMELRRKTLKAKAEKAYNAEFTRLARMFRKTQNKIYAWIAYKKGYEVDYIPGQDDGEHIERRGANLELSNWDEADYPEELLEKGIY